MTLAFILRTYEKIVHTQNAIINRWDMWFFFVSWGGMMSRREWTDSVTKHHANGSRETKNNHTLEEPFVVAKSTIAADAAVQPTAT